MPTTARRAQSARRSLYQRYRNRIQVNSDLNRSLVSYRLNRQRPFYRWLKYKEGFSAALVEYLVEHVGLSGGCLLDPFAGTGAALMAAREKGLEGLGIELLPVGVKAIQARLAADKVDPEFFRTECEAFRAGRWKVRPQTAHAFPHLKITDGAFAADTLQQLNRFRTYLAEAPLSLETRALLDLACLSVLESISYTRKDGQYLRWDHRAPRHRKGSAFHKGTISTFDQAMQDQLQRMLDDLTSAAAGRRRPAHQVRVKVLEGSCLDLLPTLPDGKADLVITSPPYCNRYDYTRTYALELAFLGVDEDHLKGLRQALLSCTVENRSKVEQLRGKYQRRGDQHLLESALESYENQAALQEALSRLDALGKQGRLNNNNVPRMVRNYFVESAVVIFELARIVNQGGHVALVNDNVQYGGEEVPVDLILCELARAAGFKTRRIWVLPRGKGNSSQQMGRHGRQELRKCVYLWQR